MKPERNSPLSRPGNSIREALVAFVLLGAIAGVLYSPALFGGKFLLLRDIHSQFYGMRWWYKESLLAGELPQWNPYISCGTPLLANPQGSVFYPGTLIFLVLPVATAFAVNAAFHNALLGFFSYLFGRTLGLSFWGALLAGIVSASAGMPVKLAEFPEEVAALAWTPLILLGAWKCLANPSRRASAIFGIAIAMQLLAGCPYPPLYSAIGVLCILAARSARRFLPKYFPQEPENVRWPARILCLGGGVTIGVLIACVQYIPTLLLVRDTPREELAAIMPPLFSLRLRDALYFISPWIAGYPNWQKCFYVGIAPVFFAATAVIVFFKSKKDDTSNGSTRQPQFAPEAVMFCVAMIFFGWVLSQAGYLGLDRLIAALPLLSRTMKWPTLAMTLAIPAVALLSGAGLDRWFHERRNLKSKGSLVLLGMVCLFSLAMAADAVRGGVWLEQLRIYLQEKILPMTSASLGGENYPLGTEATRLALCGGALAAILFLQTRIGRQRFTKPAICLLTAAELLTAWRGVHFYSPENLYLEKPATLQFAGQTRDISGLERFAVPKDFIAFNDLAYGSQSPEDFRFLRKLLVGNVAMNFHAFTTQGTGSVPLNEYAFELQPVLDDLAAQRTQNADRILGAWNVSVILEGDLDAGGQFHFGTRRTTNVLARARFVEKVVSVRNQKEALEKIARCEWDTASALVDSEQHPLAIAAKNFSAGRDEPGKVLRIIYSPNEILAKAEANGPCILVLAENWAKGWSAKIDGAPVAVHRVNFLQQAVLVPQGKHEIIFRYSTPGLRLGLFLSALGVLAVGLCLICPRK